MPPPICFTSVRHRSVASLLQHHAPIVSTMASLTPSEEYEQLRRELPQLQISSATDDFITASYGRTPYTTVRATLTFPEGYPNSHPLIVAIQASDVVITMGCGDACPLFPGKRYEDWKLDDPAGQGIDAVRPIRDDIRARIEQLVSELV